MTDDPAPYRDSGDWTREKLRILECYARGFVTASKRAGRGCFIDGFAGPGLNRRKGTTDDLFPGSPLVAIAAGFERVFLIDRSRRNTERLLELVRRTEPGSASQHIEVLCGDANQLVLDSLRKVPDYSPALVFLDPNSTEVNWHTLENIAAHRAAFRKNKAELLINFPSDFVLLRQLPIGRQAIAESKITAMFGTNEWKSLESVRLREEGGQVTGWLRSQLVNFYADRIHSALGYQHKPLVRPVRICSSTGRTGYFLIFATDHPAGERIMGHCFGTFSDGLMTLDLGGAVKD